MAGGLTYQLIKQITANANAYVNKPKVDNCFGGSIWKPIKVQEMYHALGTIQKMSMDNRQLGGIKLYFNPPHTMISGPSHAIKVICFSVWASGTILEYQFLQICATLNLKISSLTVCDQSHQLHVSIVSTNVHAKPALILGYHCSVNERGIANKS